LPDELAPEAAIIDKFMDNAAPIISAERAQRIRDAILDIESLKDVRNLTRMLGGNGS
jgi:hypothetical protein